ncbi:MAG TPA: mandelate racemase/muconate lactonizing enzyme family protein [Acidimicrobiales bacterium]|nr:mandelate racemase/muconate lactonizing enzyme family protein [Acidimicrobiales bacterium]
MTIRSVRAIPVVYPEPNDSNSVRSLLFCRIEDEDGRVGWGEAITQFPEASRAAAVLLDGLADTVVGRDVLDHGAIMADIEKRSWWYTYGGGIGAFVTSALDVALWDLKGKVLGRSVSDLIGGARRATLPVIASTHAFNASLDFEIERHGAYVQNDGFKGIKIGMGKRGDARLGYEFDRDVNFVAGLREAIGPDAMLIMDRGQSLLWTVADAIRRTQAFDEYRLTWMEEPLEPYDVDGFRRLREQVSCLIGTGEREFTVRGYQDVIASGISDVVGFDPGRAGGITGGLKVIQIVESADVWFNAHAWSSAVTTAASLALSASTNRCILFEMKPLANPMHDELITEPFVHDHGVITVPDGPGLGVEVLESVLEHYRLT